MKKTWRLIYTYSMDTIHTKETKQTDPDETQTQRAPRELLPFLTAEENKELKTKTGFLNLRNPEIKLKIGAVASKEFKLIHCLFSPENFLSAKHKSVSQTRERVIVAIEASGEAMLQKSIQSLKRKEIGKFLTFTFHENKIQMLVG
jgi:hypothetical protein